MKNNILFVIIILFGLQSCQVRTSGNWKDENIDTIIKREIDALDKKLMEAANTNNSTLLEEIMSDELIEFKGDSLKFLTNQLEGLFNNSEIEILNQYYLKVLKINSEVSVSSGNGLINDYVLEFNPLNHEMFVSLNVVTKGLNKYLILSIYGKHPEGWKLNILRFGQYAVNGKTATELYAAARYDYKNGYLVDAAANMYLCSQISQPASVYWRYQRDTEMQEFYETILSDYNTQFTFPIVLENIPSHPQIFELTMQEIEDGYYPMIRYHSEIDLKDTVLTRIENDLIHEDIEDVFKGIRKDKKYIYYKAFNEMPNDYVTVDTYGFVKELENK